MAKTKAIILFLVCLLLFPSIANSHQKRFTPKHHVAPVASAHLASLALTTPLPFPDPPAAAHQMEQYYPALVKNADSPVFQIGKNPSLPVVATIPLQLNIEGISNVNQSPNPDTDGEVGPNHYFQMVKYAFAIWDKNGTLLYGPANNKTLWSNLPGPWNNLDYYTDPIVVYDHLSDRWLASAMVYDIPNQYFELIAVSQTSDPTGGWNCYAYTFDNMPDYPKFGVWPDGYYMTVNEAYIPPSSPAEWKGLTVMVFNREDMISGTSNPRAKLFHVPSTGTDMYADPSCFLPADLDGPLPPPGTPNFLACIKDDQMGFPSDQLWIWKCTVDWNDTTNCSLEEDTILMVQPFTGNLNTINPNTIRQPNTTYRLFTMGDRLMHRLQYRNFGTYQTLVTCHTVQDIPGEHAAKRWYELRRQGNNWFLHQQGTYCPDDNDRWMGSVAMDVNGNMAMGYSVSGNNISPSIRITGRKAEDPLNTMTFGETEIVEGGGFQVVNNRWGDYSCMTVDPADELHFWYTQQYVPVTGSMSWQTRIVSFTLDTAMVNVSEKDDTPLIFSVFPNPSAGHIRVSLTMKNASPLDISLIDMYGKTILLYKSPGVLQKGEHSFDLSFTGSAGKPIFSPGIAAITIFTNRGYGSRKLILLSE
ncbi:MAG: hypothetical protein WCO02_00035 [Bacteroidota bacterium]